MALTFRLQLPVMHSELKITGDKFSLSKINANDVLILLHFFLE